MQDGTAIAYGFDAPTGGFFFQLYVDDPEANYNELDFKNSLTLTALVDALALYNIVVPKQDLIKEFIKTEKPTPLQINVGKMFGKDVIDMLSKVGLDIMENYSLFLPSGEP
jgi:hypothetical protein